MTRALILAAGQGTRLRPLTNDKPKCMVELCGRSLLSRQVETLQRCGVDKVHIVTGYMKEVIEAQGFNTSFSRRYDSTNMVASLFAARDFIDQEGDLLISYGDIVYEPENLQRLLDCDNEIAIMIDRNWYALWSSRLENPIDDAETLQLDNNGFITELGKKPENYDQIQGQYTGLIKVRSTEIPAFIAFYEALDRSAEYDGNNFDNMYMTSFIQLLISAGWEVKASLVESGWLEVDSVDDLNAYETMQQQGVLAKFYRL